MPTTVVDEPPAGATVHKDPALDARNQHHEHIHHGSHAGRRPSSGEPAYVRGILSDDRHVPTQHSPTDDVELGTNEKVELPVTVEDIVGGETGSDSSEPKKPGKAGRFYRRYRGFVHSLSFLLVTGWWIASLIFHRDDKNWVVPFLLWLLTTIRIVTLWVPASYVLRPLAFVWNRTVAPLVALIPRKMQLPAAVFLVVSVFLVGTFAPEESLNNTLEDRAISLCGLLVFIAVFAITSENRRAINWHTVLVGMLMQFIIAVFVLRTTIGYHIFTFVSELAGSLLGSARYGTAFITTTEVAKLPYFIISVLPAIIFFVALVELLFYWGALQWFIEKSAVFFFWSMRVSGAEAVVAVASPFVGQGASVVLVRPFVAHLTMAELHQVMASGFATISGAILVVFIAMGVNPQALISSCVMSIPASLAVSKLRYPETEESLTVGKVVIPEDDENQPVNGLHAFANGSWLGLKIAGMILTTMLCILALLALVNGLLTWWGRYLNINDPTLTVELIVGYICYPISFLLGVSREGGDIYKVARLIGTKIIVNEFVAYTRLQTEPEFQTLSDRSRLIATYALCGFGNLSSLAQIGAMSQLAPGRSGDVLRLAVSAMIAGIVSTFTSASVAGMVVTNQRRPTDSPK